mmetsp:Transcript_47505/g.69645  ORF Transcript_47505/g.69645 Transcript_47505/m.69645 type:complete len:218 (-) Transcript_47505:97-750(-)
MQRIDFFDLLAANGRHVLNCCSKAIVGTFYGTSSTLRASIHIDTRLGPKACAWIGLPATVFLLLRILRGVSLSLVHPRASERTRVIVFGPVEKPFSLFVVAHLSRLCLLATPELMRACHGRPVVGGLSDILGTSAMPLNVGPVLVRLDNRRILKMVLSRIVLTSFINTRETVPLARRPIIHLPSTARRPLIHLPSTRPAHCRIIFRRITIRVYILGR